MQTTQVYINLHWGCSRVLSLPRWIHPQTHPLHILLLNYLLHRTKVWGGSMCLNSAKQWSHTTVCKAEGVFIPALIAEIIHNKLSLKRFHSFNEVTQYQILHTSELEEEVRIDTILLKAWILTEWIMSCKRTKYTLVVLLISCWHMSLLVYRVGWGL